MFDGINDCCYTVACEKVREDVVVGCFPRVAHRAINPLKSFCRVARQTIGAEPHDWTFRGESAGLCVKGQGRAKEQTIFVMQVEEIKVPISARSLIHGIPIRHASKEWTREICKRMKR